MTLRACKLCWLLTSLPLLAGCRLTTTEVEPDLPAGRVEGTATLVYRANGLPVVANNAANLGTLVGALLGASLPITAKLRPDSTLTIFATDIANLPAKTPYHHLTLEVKHFRGAGTYALAAGSSFYVTTYDSQGYPVAHASQLPLAGTSNQLVVTNWQSVTKMLQGTFALRVAGPGNPQTPTVLSEGSLDVDVQ